MKNIVMRIRVFFISVLTVYSLTSCTRQADLDTGESSIVVNCILRFPSQTQELSLSYSVPNGQKESIPIDEADVTLFDNTDNSLAATFTSLGEGRWQAPISICPEHEYKLTVNVDENYRITATTTVPESKTMSYMPYGKLTWTRHIASDHIIRSLCSTDYDLSVFNTPVWMYIWNYDTINKTHVIADNITTTNSYADGFNKIGVQFPLVKEWEKRAFNFLSILHSKYLRIEPREEVNNALSTYIAGDFSEPFYSALTSSELPTLENPITNYTGPNTIPDEEKGCVVLLSVSNEYDKYLKDIITRKQKEAGDDFTILYDNTPLYSNINGGVGIFGAMLTYYLPWDVPADLN